MKVYDHFSAFACNCCHDVVDGRRKAEGWDATDLIRGMYETHTIWLEMGLITIKGMKGR
jgi:hypothetical protein